MLQSDLQWVAVDLLNTFRVSQQATVGDEPQRGLLQQTKDLMVTIKFLQQPALNRFTVISVSEIKLSWNILFKSHLTCEWGRLWVNGTFIEHSHDLANKLFGDKIGKR